MIAPSPRMAIRGLRPRTVMSFFRTILRAIFGGGQESEPGVERVSSAPAATTRPRPRKTLGLDAGDFLPIARQELQRAAKKIQLWGNPWFGRRDVIPPVEDERTKLIDRALVTNGLLSPEQLVEIHEVGAEMERVRPSIASVEHQAVLAGETAVQAERERKAQIKQQKKAEAAERKRQRAEAIAHRKATDILYLGRSVSGR